MQEIFKIDFSNGETLDTISKKLENGYRVAHMVNFEQSVASSPAQMLINQGNSFSSPYANVQIGAYGVVVVLEKEERRR